MVNPPLKTKSKLGNKMIKFIFFHSFFSILLEIFLKFIYYKFQIIFIILYFFSIIFNQLKHSMISKINKR